MIITFQRSHESGTECVTAKSYILLDTGEFLFEERRVFFLPDGTVRHGFVPPTIVSGEYAAGDYKAFHDYGDDHRRNEG